MKYFLIASIFLVSFQSLAKIDIEKRRTQILNIIDEELDEVKRLARQGGNLDPDLVLRRAELNLEKARLYREKENQSYLKLPVKKRIKVNKKRYFSTS
ncbi:MAG: hypothetical protein HON90_09660, partial [Halobacteriovoraceae bacterium]|nr:hypothetical protein [Halobacteriovoraceae bacterium]